MTKKAPSVAKHLVPQSIGVKTIPTDNLVPNPHNPRMLFDRAPLEILKTSIAKVGILVPLTVYRDKVKGNYVILDGQRRWLCAKELGLTQVPANEVAEPTLVQNIVTMFQIHKLREDWELMPTALKLGVLMKELKESGDNRLANLTGLNQAVVVRCKKLLSYPKKYQDMMLHADPEKRVKADFFIELHAVISDRTVNKMRWFSRDKFVHQMLNKYQSGKGGLKAVTDFRVMKQYISNARRAGKTEAIGKRLQEFVRDDSLMLDHLAIQSASVAAATRKLLKAIETLEEALRDVDVADYYGEEKLWDELERLLKLIQAKLSASGRRVKQ